jgi:PAS domain S-box-containing protein
MPKALHLLVLEENPHNAALIVETLKEAGYACQWERITTQSEFLAHLETWPYDVVLASDSLSTLDGLTALRLLREQDSDLPFILISDTVNQEIAIESLNAGVTDYVFREHLSRLVPAIPRALRERKEKQQRQRAERLLDTLNRAALATASAATPQEIFTTMSEMLQELGLSYILLTTDERQTTLRPTYMSLAPNLVRTIRNLTGLTPERFTIPIKRVDVYKKAVWDKQTVFVQNAEEAMRQILPGAFKGLAGQVIRMLDYSKSMVAPLIIDNVVIGILAVNSNDLVADDLPAITAFAHQIATAWHRAQLFEQARHELAKRRQAEEASVCLTTAIEQAAEMVVITDTEGAIQYVNPAFEQVTGYSRQEVIGQNPRILNSGRQNAAFYRALWATIASGEVWRGRFVNRKKDSSLYTAEATISPVRDETNVVTSYVAVKRDVTDEIELEERYRQAQKMEAIGRLAGGVAHDFNNLLTVIQGYTDLALAQLERDHPVSTDLSEIARAAAQASALTAQLLTFSRHQALEPSLIDLNELVKNATKMLRRLIGEDIELHLVAHPTLGRVLADAAQIEQVIMNLAVNARDAMPRGGTLTFETHNISLDKAYAEVHPGVNPGAYVQLAVSDTGTGMTKEVQAHLFEPFFTTKAEGKGTGLGLATVWGIVEQSEGHIEVYSELGIGTTVKVYLPRVDAAIKDTELEMDRKALPRGNETVLLVEDEEPVRELAGIALQKQGYTVLSAGHPNQALLLGKQYAEAIHLLVTDVVMPSLGGRELAERLRQSCPEMLVLYISGYSNDAIAQHGVLAPGITLLPKPFTPAALAHKVREVLDGPNRL